MKVLRKVAVSLLIVMVVILAMLASVQVFADDAAGAEEQQTEETSLVQPNDTLDERNAFTEEAEKASPQNESTGQPMASNAASNASSNTKPEAASSGSDASPHMHAAITTDNDTYESGTTAIVSVRYTLDQNSIHAGDYVIVRIPEEIASKVIFSLNKQHFSGFEDLGSGQYKLTFAKDIESGLSGSFHAYVTAKSVKKTVSGTISAGNASVKISVVPSGSPGGSGTYTDTIMKDGAENEKVSFGGYDYSDGYGDHASQIGIADLTEGGTFKYRLYINDKQGKISNVTVIDRIPDGMTINQSKGIEVTDRTTGKKIAASAYSVSCEGQTLIFRYPGAFSNTIQINYWVDIPAGSNTAKYTNSATITYMQDGGIHQEHRSYILQGTENNAVNGEKSVDKSIISTDPDDQFVTYTIKFWNSNGFGAGEINLTDLLDPHVTFVGADLNEYFVVKQDSSDPQKIHIFNTKAISGSTTVFVRFLVDMTKAPAGYTVKNSVGGNTTKTTKYGGGLSLIASKRIDGKKASLAAGRFEFQLLDGNGSVLQTKSNDENGAVTFDRISYTFSDAGKTFTYQVREVSGDDDWYECDPTVYTVTVVPAFEKDADGNPTGKIIADPVIKKGDAAAESVVFNNTSRTGSLRLTKTSKGHSTPDDAEFIITGPDGYRRIVEYGELKGGSITISGLPAGTYTVKEEKADVDGYVLTVAGRETAEITKDNSTAEIALANTYTPEEQGGKDTPSSGTGTNTPNTGDSSDWIHWMLLSAESAALLVVLLLSRKPRKE